AEAQLDAHGGDAERSIAAMPVEAAVRSKLLGLELPAAMERSVAGSTRPGWEALPPVPTGAGRYRIGAELGRGGLGRVVEAFDPGLKRDVAIKLVLDTAAADLRERFIREAELTARLEHPNIV